MGGEISVEESATIDRTHYHGRDCGLGYRRYNRACGLFISSCQHPIHQPCLVHHVGGEFHVGDQRLARAVSLRPDQALPFVFIVLVLVVCLLKELKTERPIES